MKSVRLVDNGDNDGFADPNETVSVYVTLRNGSGVDRSGITVRMGSTDPTVDCIPSPIVAFGSLAAGQVRESTMPLVLRVADVARTDPLQDLSVTLEFTISGDDFDTTTHPQRLMLDLDLNVNGGLLPSSYTEGFENAGFGSFTTQSLDAGRETLAASDGFRCQYNDPDFVNNYSYGNTLCFLGAPTAIQNAYDWHLHGLTSPDGGRAYLGNNSLHWGVHGASAGMDTTRLKQLDAVRTTNPVNLGWNGVSPELSFKHQVGLNGCDYLNCPEGPRYFNPGERGTFDRGVVQVQLANSSGTAQGTWRTLSPYENLYDQQAVKNVSQCLFDPTDDGSDEDDLFDPSEPSLRSGPSSTCFPEFGFTRQGAIAFNAVFQANAIGRATDGPGLQGSRGPGTWVQSKFNLDRYRGRRIRLRFLATSIQVWDGTTWQNMQSWNPIDADDGWYIDDVQVTNTLVSAATVSVDTVDRGGLPLCGPVCSSATASLVVTPAFTPCDQAFVLDASGSTADQCPGGTLEFRFWGTWTLYSGAEVLGEWNATLLQDWSENSILTQAMSGHPYLGPLQYGVDVRCSTLPACGARTMAVVPLDYAPLPFPYTILFLDKTRLSWGGASAFIAAVRGDLGALRASGGNFDGTVDACLLRDYIHAQSGLVDGTAPAPGEGTYYLLREARYDEPTCSARSWRTGSAAEVPGAGGNRDVDLVLDPNTCWY